MEEKELIEKIPKAIGIITLIEILLYPIYFIIIMMGVTGAYLDVKILLFALVLNIVFQTVISLISLWRLRANKVVMIGYAVLKIILFYFWFVLFVFFALFINLLLTDESIDTSGFGPINPEQYETDNTYSYELPAKKDLDKYELLTKEEWAEFKKQEEPFTEEQLNRILRTFEGTEVEKYIHFYGYVLKTEKEYKTSLEQEYTTKLNFDEYKKASHDVALKQEKAYERLSKDNEALILPENTELYESTKSLISLMFLELASVNFAAVNVHDTLAMLEDDEIATEIKENEDISNDFIASVKESQQEYEETLIDYEKEFKMYNEILEELWGMLHPEFIEKIDNQPFN